MNLFYYLKHKISKYDLYLIASQVKDINAITILQN